MTVTVRVSEGAGSTVTIEAYNGDHRIFRSAMSCKKLTKKSIEADLRKNLKNLNSSVWGGFDIVFDMRIEE